MGFFDGMGRHLAPGRRRRSHGLDVDGHGLDRLAAEGDATRIRLSDSVYEGVSRLPDAAPADDADHPGAGRVGQPAERPHPRAQWDDVRGEWILFDAALGDWRPVGDEDH